MAETIGQYTLGERLGTDALAEIYRATDGSLGRTVTLKVFRRAVEEDVSRRDDIVAAAGRLAALSHPNIAALFEVGEQRGRHFLVFEHVAGESLRATLAGTPMNLRRAVDLAAQLADALAEAHGHSLVHGSLRPESILVSAKGRPKILDFALGTPSRGRPAAFQQMSPEDVECLSPEQVLGERGDSRTDVFAFGCVLYEMLTGRAPFAAATASDTAVAILGRTPPPPSQMNARIPEALDRLVMRCLAKSLDRREASAATIAAELREIAARIERADQATGPVELTFGQTPRRSSVGVVLATLVIVAVIVAAAAWLLTR